MEKDTARKNLKTKLSMNKSIFSPQNYKANPCKGTYLTHPTFYFYFNVRPTKVKCGVKTTIYKISNDPLVVFLGRRRFLLLTLPFTMPRGALGLQVSLKM